MAGEAAMNSEAVAGHYRGTAATGISGDASFTFSAGQDSGYNDFLVHPESFARNHFAGYLMPQCQRRILDGRRTIVKKMQIFITNATPRNLDQNLSGFQFGNRQLHQFEFSGYYLPRLRIAAARLDHLETDDSVGSVRHFFPLIHFLNHASESISELFLRHPLV